MLGCIIAISRTRESQGMSETNTSRPLFGVTILVCAILCSEGLSGNIRMLPRSIAEPSVSIPDSDTLTII
jgi:hypothetical protein